jgi:hypothetical protein
MAYAKFLTLAAMTTYPVLALLSAGRPAHASPVADFTCNVPPGTSLQRDGYSLGENLYVFDNNLALEAYQEQDQQLPFKEARGAITYYGGNDITVAVFPDGAQIEFKSGLIIPCVANVDDGLSEGADGISHGSSVRKTADVSGEKIDRLAEGEPVFVSQNAGNAYQGYDWFLVEYSEGLKGYVWGGTLCSVGFKVPGIANECGQPF